MKKIQIAIVLLGMVLSVNGQSLIENGSFENYIGVCDNPSANGDFNNNVISWYSTGPDQTHGYSSVDLYCGQANYGACTPGPELVGSDGSVYAGFHTRLISPPYNEAIYQILNNPLKQDSSYTLSLDLITCKSGLFNGTDDFHIYSNIDSIVPLCPTDAPTVQLLGTISLSEISDSQWQTHSINFNAPANCNVLFFSGTCEGTQTYYYLDNIVLIKSEKTTLVENDFDNKLRVFPNPTDGDMTIDLGTNYNSVTISITQLDGSPIQSNSYNASQILNLDLGEENPGVYLLTIMADKKKAVIRIVKN